MRDKLYMGSDQSKGAWPRIYHRPPREFAGTIGRPLSKIIGQVRFVLARTLPGFDNGRDPFGAGVTASLN